jgi:hypothetical protein
MIAGFTPSLRAKSPFFGRAVKASVAYTCDFQPNSLPTSPLPILSSFDSLVVIHWYDFFKKNILAAISQV